MQEKAGKVGGKEQKMVKIKRVKKKFKYSLTSATTNVLKIDLKQEYYQNTKNAKISYILYTTDISKTVIWKNKKYRKWFTEKIITERKLVQKS